MEKESDILIGLRAIADAIADSLRAEETSDQLERNLPEAIEAVARAIHRLGNADAATPMGGLEAHGKAILDSADRIAGSIDNLAEAIREVGSAIAEDEPLNFSLIRGLTKIAEPTE